LIKALSSLLGPEDQVDVITTLPNRYHTFSLDAPEEERRSFIRIRRVQVSRHRSGMLDQALAFVHYARAVWCLVRGYRYDVVYATSSRLFTAFLGAVCAKKVYARLYLDIRDIFVDTINDVLPRKVTRLLLPILQRIERFTIMRAVRVNLVSEGFREYFSQRYPNQRCTYFTNGVDEEFFRAKFDTIPRSNRERLRIVYAGNFGEGQGLHRIVPNLARRCPDVDFELIGEGGRRDALVAEVQAAGVENVQILPPLPRNELLGVYRKADCLFLHLNDYAAFRKVLPSKIFEYAATGKPILAGIVGYAAEFLTSQVENSAVFPPCDAEAGIRALHRLRIGHVDRTTFIKRYERTAIMQAMARDLLAVAGDSSRVRSPSID